MDDRREILRTVGKRLEEMRRAQRQPASRVAAAIGCKSREVEEVERGEVKCRDQVVRLIQHFNPRDEKLLELNALLSQVFPGKSAQESNLSMN